MAMSFDKLIETARSAYVIEDGVGHAKKDMSSLTRRVLRISDHTDALRCVENQGRIATSLFVRRQATDLHPPADLVVRNSASVCWRSAFRASQAPIGISVSSTREARALSRLWMVVIGSEEGGWGALPSHLQRRLLLGG